MAKREDIQSILIIGAGPIVIGQACEFDYSGAQACKALKEEGYRVILVNSNPATIMTDPNLADATYIALIVAAKRGAPGLRRVHDDALKLQKQADLKRHQIEHEKNIEIAKEQYIVACDYFDRYNSERCWKSSEDGWVVFNQLKSESAKIKAVKEQIMIRTKGFGWDDAGQKI